MIIRTITVYTPDRTRALIGAIDTSKHINSTYQTNDNTNTNTRKNDVEVDGLGLKERAKGSNNSRNMNGIVFMTPSMDYIIDELREKEV